MVKNAQCSFNKWTSSNFLKDLSSNHSQILPNFVEESHEIKHRFWKRDPLAVLMDSREKLEQKLDYIHFNTLQDHWNLAVAPEKYKWSSAKYYLTGKDEFNIHTHYLERF